MRAMYVLDPTRVKALVDPEGNVFYSLNTDNLAGLQSEPIVVPAREIIHDVMTPLYHPLCGVSPIFACALAAAQGLAIQGNSATFFENGSRPGGILSAPGAIKDETAKRIKEYWENEFSGAKVGKVAVLGDGLQYNAMSIPAEEAQLIEQLKWSAETVCSCFHIPPYMIGVGSMPNYNNIEALNQQYYTQCLQNLIESIELCLDEGLGLTEISGKTYGTEFDLDDLLRMDSKTMADTEERLKIFKTVNEARKRFNLSPVEGGDTVFRQEQDHAIEALARRDELPDPFGEGESEPQDSGEEEVEEPIDEATVASFAAASLKAELARLATP